MYTYKCSSPDNTSYRKFCKQAFEANLYHAPIWMMYSRLKYAMEAGDGRTNKVTVAYYLDRPIGVGHSSDMIDRNFVMIYVSPPHRLKGVGKTLVSLLENDKEFFHMNGINGSDVFYNKAISSCVGVQK